MNLQQRISAVLMPLSSLPGKPYCGGLGQDARRFADFLQRAGQSAWQLLPVNPVDDCNSPYASISTFAGDPVYIDLEDLYFNGLLDKSDLIPPANTGGSLTDYQAARGFRLPRLEKAFERFGKGQGGKYQQKKETFLADNPWAGPHSIFSALSEKFGSPDWSQWTDERLRHFDTKQIEAVFPEIAEAVSFHTFLQLVFAVQWEELHTYCNEKRISLIGDIPIYVSKNSVDTWANPELFQLDKHGKMTRVAGVPGDSFNPDGQRWNAPLYDWEQHKIQKYGWWKQRLGNTLKRFDAVRLDHFIGFYNYFSMPPEHNPDDLGKWIPGPADDFFDVMLWEFPDAQLIAEDLGVMNQGVHQLRNKYNFPGINVFQFFWDFGVNVDKTAQWKVNSLVCTGTHDTNTLAGWVEEVFADKDKPIPFWDFKFLSDLLRPFSAAEPVETQAGFTQAVIRKVMSSPGNVAVFPLQDILGLAKDARMNFPGHAENNWLWRLDDSFLTDELADKLRSWAKEFSR